MGQFWAVYYIFPLGQLLRSLSLNFHFYPKHSDLHIFKNLISDNVAMAFISMYLWGIKWTYQFSLFLQWAVWGCVHWLTPPAYRKSFTLNVDGSILEFQTKLSLGVIFDDNLTYYPHVQNTVKKNHLRNKRLCPMLSFVWI